METSVHRNLITLAFDPPTCIDLPSVITIAQMKEDHTCNERKMSPPPPDQDNEKTLKSKTNCSNEKAK